MLLGSCKKNSIALYLVTCAWLYFYRHSWRKPEKYLKQVPLFIKSKRIKYQSSRLIDWLSLILCCLLCYCFIYLVTHFFFSNSGSSQTSHSKVGNIDVSLEIGNLPDQKVQKHNNDSLQAMVGTGNGIMDAIQILSTL